jgi:hypothetical protein
MGGSWERWENENEKDKPHVNPNRQKKTGKKKKVSVV